MPKITLKSKSSGLDEITKELRRRKDMFKDTVGAQIVIPVGGTDPATNGLDWVMWQEFGTATERVADPQYGVPGPTSEEYIIGGVPGKSMEFPDIGTFGEAPETFLGEPGFDENTGGSRGYRIPASPFKEGYVLTRKGKAITHPGFPPKRFIRSILAQARKILQIGIGNAVAKGFAQDTSFVSLEGATVTEMLKVKELIVASMESKFGPNERPDGRLRGRHPADIFQAAARVVGLGVEAKEDVRGVSHSKSRNAPSRTVAAKRAKFVSKAAARKVVPSEKATLPKAKRLSKIQSNFRNKR